MEFIYRAAPLVAFLIGIVLTVLVIRHKPRSSIHRAFALFLSSMALWGLTLSGMRVSPSLDQALPWGKATVAVLPFVSISFFHFVQLLTGSRRTRFLIIPGYAAAILAVLPASSGLVISEMKPMWYGYGFNSGPLLLPYMAVFYGIVGWGIYQLARASRTADTQQDRNRSAYVALGGVVMLLGLMTDVLASQGAPAYPMGIIGNIFFSLINTYAILRYQLLDIQVVIRKGAVYAIVSAVGVGLVIGILSVAYALVPESTRLSAWENVVVIMVLAIGIQPVLHIVQTRVDRWFDRGKYDYLKAVEKLGETTTSIIDLKHLSETLADTVALAVKTDEVSVLLPDSEERDFVAVAGQPMRLPGHSILVWWLRERQEILSQKEIETYPQFQALTAQERVLQARTLVDTWVPMVTREGL
ncbi:MAG: hypothetical protein HYX90_00775, partial [Chloroflexi bacterium]|nr:hypothetical protein [Chloroflexota bacterium]